MIKVQVAAVSALRTFLKSRIEREQAKVWLKQLKNLRSDHCSPDEEKVKEATKQTFMNSRVDPSAREAP